jgi:ribosomal protein S6
MIVFDGDLGEEAITASLSRVTATIEAAKGRVVSTLDTEPWGRRRFDQSINNKWEGFYVVLDVVTEVDSLARIDRYLRLADRSEVVRHQFFERDDPGYGDRVPLLPGPTTPPMLRTMRPLLGFTAENEH